MSLGDRIREIRNFELLSQQEFADNIGVTHAHISKLENNKVAASETLKNLLCERYNISLEWLNDGTGEMHRRNDGLNIKPRNIMSLLQSTFQLLTDDEEIINNGSECVLALLSIVDRCENKEITQKTLFTLIDILYCFVDYAAALGNVYTKKDDSYFSNFLSIENKQKRKKIENIFVNYTEDVAEILNRI